MLSSCWFTTPFTGCFNAAAKGLGGGGGEPAAGLESGRIVQSTTSTRLHASQQPVANGTAGGVAPVAAPRDVGGNTVVNSTKQQQPTTPRLEADLQKAAMEADGPDNRSYKSEYRKKFRPFSQYQYVDGKFHIKSDEPAAAGAPSGGGGGSEVAKTNAWYKEVLELRKQAGQYRHRGWGVEMASDRLAEIYSQQAELWEQVSRRSSLQALSLASASPSSSRPISKAEKEIVNSRRSSPVKHVASKERPSTAPPKSKPAGVHKAGDKVDGKSSKESTPRHHYERTTGSGEDGLLITSPSRDTIEPTVTDWSNRRSSRKTPPVTSPVKEFVGRRRYPTRTTSVARPPRPKDNNTPHRLTTGRSVSVDPQSRSPKRAARPPSGHTAPAAKPERRPRPTSLATSARRKGADTSGRPPLDDSKKPIKKGHDLTASPKKGDLKNREDKRRSSEDGEAKKDKEKDVPRDTPKDAGMEAVKEASLTGRKSTPEPRFDPEKYEPVVKTPPEPTRVKSPDQVMVKSPDPVNWTVPLDTGKTFTVTHSIPEGESSRATPSSEHRQPFETRPRQTPEPTKIYQGSLAGTPITTATTVTTSAPPDEAKPTTQVPAAVPVSDKPAAPASKFDATAPTSKPAAPELKKDERTLPDIPELKPDEKLAEIEAAKFTSAELPKSSTKDQPKMEPIPESMTSSVLNDMPPSPTSPDFHSSGAAQDPMTKSLVQDPMSKSMAPDPMTMSMTQDPMTMSMTQDPMTMSMTQDPMTMSMVHDPMSMSMTQDPMTMSMTQDPMTMSMTQDPMTMSMTQDPMTMSMVGDPMTMSMVGDPMTTSIAPDPMTMSVFGTLNGTNGKSSGEPSPTKPEAPSVPPAAHKPVSDQPIGVRTVPGTNMRCLDDPSFMFEQSKPTLGSSPPKDQSFPKPRGSVRVLEAPSEPDVPSQQKLAGYRVLSAPDPPQPSTTKISPDQPPTNLHENPVAVKPSPYRVLEAPLDDTPQLGKGSPYRVLEAPESAYYSPQPTGAVSQETKPPALVSPSTGRSVTDALDKARSRFDSFWGGSKDKDPPSKV